VRFSEYLIRRKLIFMTKKHIFPIVIQICHNIDNLFLTYVGPVGNLLCEEAFNQWKDNYKPGPLEIPYYINMLAEQMPEKEQQLRFSKEAMHLIANQIGI
jgi:hypothetical protein